MIQLQAGSFQTRSIASSAAASRGRSSRTRPSSSSIIKACASGSAPASCNRSRPIPSATPASQPAAPPATSANTSHRVRSTTIPSLEARRSPTRQTPFPCQPSLRRPSISCDNFPSPTRLSSTQNNYAASGNGSVNGDQADVASTIQSTTSSGPSAVMTTPSIGLLGPLPSELSAVRASASPIPPALPTYKTKVSHWVRLRRQCEPVDRPSSRFLQLSRLRK